MIQNLLKLSIMSLFSRSLNGRIKHLSAVQQRENSVTFEKKKMIGFVQIQMSVLPS